MIKEKIKEVIESARIVYKNNDTLIKFIAAKLNKNAVKIKEGFLDMLKNGELFEVKRGKVIVLPSNGYIKGKLIGTLKGYAFCKSAGREKDVFIAPSQINTAMDGDEVIVKIISENNEYTDGTVVKIVKRGNKTIVGQLAGSSAGFMFIPDNKRIQNSILVTKGKNMNAKTGQKVLCRLEFDFTKKHLPAEVIEVLGAADDVKTLQLAIIRANNLFEEFPEEVIAESEKISEKVLPEEKKGRVDLTKEIIFTIDGSDAKDFDDAVNIKKTSDGGYELGVHIADVTHYVKANTPLDHEAWERATSVYFPNMVLPMLPESLSNGICSLKEGVERLTMSAVISYDKNAKVVSYKLFESVIKSKKRLTYDEVYACVNGKEVDKSVLELKAQFDLMIELSKKLESMRIQRGALDLDIPEPQFLFDKNGYVNGVTKRERNDAHKLIESFMIAANEVVAKEFCLKKIPFVYRVHESPTLIKVKDACLFLEGLGLSVPALPKKQIEPKYVQELISLLVGKPYGEAANKIILRSLQKAKYGNECLGHFGLALEFYSHFTSPIRRYPDLAIHRIMKEFLKKGKFSKERLDELQDFTFEAGEQSSNRERLADTAERDVDDLWKAYLMKDHIGEEFEGIITSVVNFGLFIGLENSVEGLVRIENLPKEGYLFLEKSMKLKGPDRTFSIGDKVRVKLINVELESRRVDFSLV